MADKCKTKVCASDKICNPDSGRCVLRSGKIGKKISSKKRSPSKSPKKSRSRSRSKSPKRNYGYTDREYLNLQTVVRLKAYIVSRDPKRLLSGWSKLRKAELINFILKNIDVETGALRHL